MRLKRPTVEFLEHTARDNGVARERRKADGVFATIDLSEPLESVQKAFAKAEPVLEAAARYQTADLEKHEVEVKRRLSRFRNTFGV